MDFSKELSLVKPSRVFIIILLGLLIAAPVVAQDELATSLEVLSPGVEVLRVNTTNWISVNLEGIVGVGDMIRTDTSGRARVTFFADGTDTEILPNTTYHITEFRGAADRFSISAEVLIGQTIQRLSRLLDAASSYEITTPGMSLGARGTAFAVRVEESGRSGMLVSEGAVAADNADESASVDPGFGIRAEPEGNLSDVVRATTFEELDAALDGCAAVLTTPDDVSLNVRLGADTSYTRVGTISASEVTTLFGIAESGSWYRIEFRGGFGWILSSAAALDEGCVGLREFPDGFGPEDASLYSALGDQVELEDLLPTPTPGA